MTVKRFAKQQRSKVIVMRLLLLLAGRAKWLINNNNSYSGELLTAADRCKKYPQCPLRPFVRLSQSRIETEIGNDSDILIPGDTTPSKSAPNLFLVYLAQPRQNLIITWQSANTQANLR